MLADKLPIRSGSPQKRCRKIPVSMSIYGSYLSPRCRNLKPDWHLFLFIRGGIVQKGNEVKQTIGQSRCFSRCQKPSPSSTCFRFNCSLDYCRVRRKVFNVDLTRPAGDWGPWPIKRERKGFTSPNDLNFCHFATSKDGLSRVLNIFLSVPLWPTNAWIFGIFY